MEAAIVGACVRPWTGEDVEAVKAKTNELMQASMKLGEAMYKAQQETGSATGGRGFACRCTADDVIDADFKEVGEDDQEASAPDPAKSTAVRLRPGRRSVIDACGGASHDHFELMPQRG